VVLLCAAIAYTILQMTIIRLEGPHSKLAAAVKKDVKGKIAIVMYISRSRWRSSNADFLRAVRRCGVHLAHSGSAY
jgi:hypothetical protein